MFCSKCGIKVNDTDKYCLNCGNKLFNNEINDCVNNSEYVSEYNTNDLYSYKYLFIAIVLFVLSLIPINNIYMIVMVLFTLVSSIVDIIRYKKIKDRVSFISILISLASLYTSIGWLYYLIVK